jgi:hypothetical protein
MRRHWEENFSGATSEGNDRQSSPSGHVTAAASARCRYSWVVPANRTTTADLRPA